MGNCLASSFHKKNVVNYDEDEYTSNGSASVWLSVRMTVLRREIGDERGMGMLMVLLGKTEEMSGNHKMAASLMKEGLEVLRNLNDKQGMASPLYFLGMTAVERSEYGRAVDYFQVSLNISHELGERVGIANALTGLGRLALAQGSPDRAARLFAAADPLRTTIGAPLPACDQKRFDRDISTVRAALEEKIFTTAWAEGKNMTVEQAVAYTLSGNKGGVNN